MANYSTFDTGAVIACGAPQLVVSAFATHDTPEVRSWRLTQPVVRDERLHELALMAIYNLRSDAAVLLLLEQARCRDALQAAAERIHQRVKTEELLRCLDSFDGGGSAPPIPMVIMQCQVPAGAVAGSKVTMLTPSGPLEVGVPAGFAEGDVFPVEFKTFRPTTVLETREINQTTSVTLTAAAAGDVRLCPITQQIMDDPYWCADGVTYERSALVHKLREMEKQGKVPCSPLTDVPLAHSRLIPDSETRCEDVPSNSRPDLCLLSCRRLQLLTKRS